MGGFLSRAIGAIGARWSRLRRQLYCRWLLRGLGPSDIAIECGANTGRFTLMLARTGARVYAFEPNPHAFRVLCQRIAGYRNVVCLNKAAWVEEGSVQLYLHRRAPEDQVLWSSGSSLLADKPNVDPCRWVEVECVDLAAFVGALGRPVRLMAIDVEGAECELLTHLLRTGAWRKVSRIVVEAHEHKIPALREPMRRLRRLIRACGADNVKFLHWW